MRGISPWRSTFAIAGSDLEKIERGTFEPYLYLSVLGTPGITAWVGLHRVVAIVAGETLIVSGATGTIGGIAGQLARRHGCTVIGIAGGPEKCAYAREALHFDQCLDHKDPEFTAQLAAVQAQVYFENVGGKLLDTVLPALAEHARIALCGMIAHYDTTRLHQFGNLHLLLERVIETRPYRVSEHGAYHRQAIDDLSMAFSQGAVTPSHTIAQGLEAVPSAFVVMMQGRSLGKSIVRAYDGVAA